MSQGILQDSHIQQYIDTGIVSYDKTVAYAIRQQENSLGIPIQYWSYPQTKSFLASLSSANATYTVRKYNCVKRYLFWLAENGFITLQDYQTHGFFACDEQAKKRKRHIYKNIDMSLQNDEFEKSCFGSADEFAAYVDYVCTRDSSCYVVLRTALALTWVGLKRREITLLKKTDYHKPDETGFPYITVHGKTVDDTDYTTKYYIVETFCRQAIENAINAAADVKITSTGARQYLFNPAEYEYVIRSTRTQTPKPREAMQKFSPVEHIEPMIAGLLEAKSVPERLNPFYEKTVNLASIRYSGAFWRIDNDLPCFVTQDYINYSSYWRHYQMIWKNKYKT